MNKKDSRSQYMNTVTITNCINNNNNKNKCKEDIYFFEVNKNRGEKLNFFPSHFSIIVLGSVRLVGIILSLFEPRKRFIMSFYWIDKKKFTV